MANRQKKVLYVRLILFIIWNSTALLYTWQRCDKTKTLFCR